MYGHFGIIWSEAMTMVASTGETIDISGNIIFINNYPLRFGNGFGGAEFIEMFVWHETIDDY